MQNIIVRFILQPNKRDSFLELLKVALIDTRNFKGCISIETYTDEEDPNSVWLLQKWQSRNDYDEYVKWRLANGMIEALAPFVSKPLEITFIKPYST
jgi:quinol monooxygenase YgiN